MKENEFLDGVSNVDSDVVERFVSMDNRLQKKPQKAKNILKAIMQTKIIIPIGFPFEVLPFESIFVKSGRLI